MNNHLEYKKFLEKMANTPVEIDEELQRFLDTPIDWTLVQQELRDKETLEYLKTRLSTKEGRKWFRDNFWNMVININKPEEEEHWMHRNMREVSQKVECYPKEISGIE